MEKLSAQVSTSKKSPAEKTIPSPFDHQAKPARPLDQVALSTSSKQTAKDSKSPSSSEKASKPATTLPELSQKPSEKADGRISRQASIAKAPAEDGLTRRSSLKRKAEPPSEQHDMIDERSGKALPAVPARLLSEKANGIGRAESGELPQDPGTASMSAAGAALILKRFL